MNARKILIITVASLILVDLAKAEGEKLGVTFDLTYMSKWMTRGKEGYGQQGAFFEIIDLDLWGSGFGTAVTHQSATASGYVDKQRFNYKLYYANSLFDGEPYKTKYKLNWTYKNYYGRARNIGNTQEWKFVFSWPELLSKGLEPYYISHYEYPAGSNYDISRLRVLVDNVQHIRDIASMQQSYAKVSGVEAQISLSKLVEDAIQINSAGLERHGVQLIREFEELPDVEIDKQRTLQILVNLINNAKYALSDSNKEEKLLSFRIYKHCEDRFRIEVADNGVGISEDNLTKIFSHGFTTMEHGHGFGLHSCALTSKEMGGSLTVHGEGVGQGATFTLELPFKPVGVVL